MDALSPNHSSSNQIQLVQTPSRTSWAFGIVLALGLPPIWILSGWFQLFQPPGWVDPGIYLGYFLEISEKISTYGANYFSMRLPFTALGAVLYYLLPAEWAQKVLIAFFNSVAASALFTIVARRHSIAAGVFASWWLTLNPLWLAAIARGYIDGPAMSLLLASLALLDQRDQWRNPRLAVVIAGGFAASAMFTHPLMVVLFGLSALADIAVKRPRMTRLMLDALLLFVGMVTATAALGFASQLVGGKFLFFLADNQAFTRSLEGFGSNYRYALAEWIPNAFRLAPLAATLLLGMLVLVRRKTAAPSTLIISGLALAGGTTAFLLFWDYVVGGATLQSSFYSSYTLVGQALVFGTMAGIAINSLDYRTRVATALLALTVALLMLSQVDAIWALHDLTGSIFAWLSIATIFVLAGCLLFTRIRALAICLVIGATTLSGILNYDTRRIFNTASSVDFETTFRSTLAVASFVKEHHDSQSGLAFWFDRNSLTQVETHRSFFTVYKLRFRDSVFTLNYWDSLVALWLWDRSLLGASMPDLEQDQMERLQIPGSRWAIVTLCLQPEECEAGASRLTNQGLQATEIARKAIDEGYVPFTAIMYAVAAAPESDS